MLPSTDSSLCPCARCCPCLSPGPSPCLSPGPGPSACPWIAISPLNILRAACIDKTFNVEHNDNRRQETYDHCLERVHKEGSAHSHTEWVNKTIRMHMNVRIICRGGFMRRKISVYIWAGSYIWGGGG